MQFVFIKGLTLFSNFLKLTPPFMAYWKLCLSVCATKVPPVTIPKSLKKELKIDKISFFIIFMVVASEIPIIAPM